MRPVLTAAFLAVSALPATADITWKADRIAPGSVLVLEADTGAVFTHMKRGAEQGQFRFDTFAGESVAGTYIGSYLTTATGDITKIIGADGTVTQFKPHRCMRTLGECSYTIVHADGSREARKRVTRETRGGLAWQEYSRAGLEQSGELALDAMGSTKGGWTKDARSGKRTKTRRIMVAYR